MGVTYQTQDRIRRKVMTAPLPALPEETTPSAKPIKRMGGGKLKAFWPLAAAGAAIAAVVIGIKAF